MRQFIIFFVAVLMNSAAFAQEWEWQNPLPTYNYLYDVQFVDVNNGWTVGTSGTIIRTTDGGITWENQNSGTSLPIREMIFVDQNHGWAVGSAWSSLDSTGSVILHTSDGGDTWVTQLADNGYLLSGVDFVDANHGWAVGYTVGVGPIILNTTDAGVNWTSQITDSSVYSIGAVDFVDASTGWVVGNPGWQGNGSILHTTDGGESWSTQYSDSGWHSYSMKFVDPNHGWVAGPHLILNTTDGGQTWTEQDPGPDLWAVEDVDFVDVDNGWAVGIDNMIVHTTDGGQTWLPQSNPSQGYHYAVDFIDANHGWVVGGAAIWRTSDGGNQWIQLNMTDNLHGVHFVNDSLGWAVGDSAMIVHTTNGGTSWTVQVCDTFARFQSVDFVDENHGWVVGGDANDLGIVMHTTNGGVTWMSQTTWTNSLLLDVDFVDVNNGWAVGGNFDWEESTILHTTDGGETWVTQFAPSNLPFTGVDFVDVNHGFLSGAPGARTTDGGETWSAMGAGGYCTDVDFIDLNNGWIAGGDAGAGYMYFIMHTSDGGLTWNTQLWEGGGYITAVAFADANHGWATGHYAGAHGAQQLFWQTTNGGETWTPDATVEAVLFGVAMGDARHGWVVGEGGAILHLFSPPLPLIFVDPGLLMFGQVHIGSDSAALLEIRNTGEAPLTVLTMTAPEGYAALFNLPLIVAAGDSATDTVLFSPAEVRPYFDTLVVTSDAPGGPVSVALRGFGVPSLTADKPGSELPRVYALKESYPNPFNPTTTIAFDLPRAGHISLRVFDLLGREVAVLKDKMMEAGKHRVMFEGGNLASGIYFARLEAGEFTQTNKLMLLK